MGNVRLRLKDKATGFNYDFKPKDGTILEDGVLEIPTDRDGSLLTMEMLVDGGNMLVNEYSRVNAPTILSPRNNETGVIGWFTASEFVNETSIPLVFKGIRWQIANDINFEDMVYSIDMEYGYSVNPNMLASNKELYVRCQYILDKLVSNWSEAVKFTTGPAFISSPIVTVTEYLAGQDIIRARVTTSDFNITGMNGSHTSTTWRVIDTETNTVVEEILSGNKGYFDMNLKLLTKGKVYKVEAIHNANSGVSLNGYTYYKFDRNVIWVGPDDNIVLVGENSNTFYFGEVGVDQLDGTYNYRGEWGINSGRPDKDYVVDEQVTHNGVLYKALKDHTNVTPGTDATTWIVDTRDNLPTGKWLLDQVGIGYGLTDNNLDSKSSGSVKLGNLKNNDQGWLKYLHNGKLIYIAKKPWCDTIAWTDIAKREAELGKRTIRIGRHLYYVRLVHEDEYVNCLLNTTNGILDMLSEIDISLAEKTWLIDEQVGTFRKRTSGNIIGNIIENADAKSRTGSYRPVLEYIPEGSEPYNNIKSGIPMATNENFQYDFYTDTGYFGHVPSTSLFGAGTLATKLGVTTGSVRHDTAGYFKFYWHGLILYVSKHAARINYFRPNAENDNIVYGKDMGGNGFKSVTLGNNTFASQLLLGCKSSPVDITIYLNHSNTVEAFNRNVSLEIGKGGQYNDLIFRVNVHVPSNRWQDIKDYNNALSVTSGVQIGKNWANYTNSEMSIYHAVTGDGHALFLQELGSNLQGSTSSLFSGDYRLTDIHHYPYSSSSNNAYGVRFVLKLL